LLGRLLQFTSGSTGAPRGVSVPSDSLAANIQMIHEWLEWGPDDAVGSWLPLHHDMGLIGLCLAPVCAQNDIWALRPREFLLAPDRWLDSFTRGASVTASPPFGYAYAARRAESRKFDLSTLRAAVVGAEMLAATPLLQFAARFSAAGFRPASFCPAYGLAEATLAVTGSPPTEQPRAVSGITAQAGTGANVSGPELCLPETGVENPAASGILVSSGRPLPGIDLTILGEDGEPLEDRIIGEIAVDTPSLADGYLTAQGERSPLRIRNAQLITGDLGFMIGSDLFVLGRLGDALKVRGQLYLAEQLELELASRLGLEPHRLVVACQPSQDGPSATIVLEGTPATEAVEASRVLRSILGPGAQVSATAVDRGWIPRTTSGKPRRHETTRRLGTQTAYECPAPGIRPNLRSKRPSENLPPVMVAAAEGPTAR
jgi:acyl-CoA synthetase (AMP-forming)/AMP-acid ligase II